MYFGSRRNVFLTVSLSAVPYKRILFGICDDAVDHKIKDVTVEVTQGVGNQNDPSNIVCTEITDAEGDYVCDVVPGNDYRVTPAKEENPVLRPYTCGCNRD